MHPLVVVVESAQSPRLDRARERDRPRHLIDRLGPIKALTVGSEPIEAIAVRIHLHRVIVRPDLRVAMPAEHVAAMGRKETDLKLLVLDPKTGATVRTQDVKVKDAGSFMKIAYDDKTLFVETFGMLHTFDVATLKPGWWVGSFWVDK